MTHTHIITFLPTQWGSGKLAVRIDWVPQEELYHIWTHSGDGVVTGSIRYASIMSEALREAARMLGGQRLNHPEVTSEDRFS